MKDRAYRLSPYAIRTKNAGKVRPASLPRIAPSPMRETRCSVLSNHYRTSLPGITREGLLILYNALMLGDLLEAEWVVSA